MSVRIHGIHGIFTYMKIIEIMGFLRSPWRAPAVIGKPGPGCIFDMPNVQQRGNSFFWKFVLNIIWKRSSSRTPSCLGRCWKKQRLPGLTKEANAWAFGHIPQRLSLLASLRAAQNENGLVPVTPASWEMAPWVCRVWSVGSLGYVWLTCFFLEGGIFWIYSGYPSGN